MWEEESDNVTEVITPTLRTPNPAEPTHMEPPTDYYTKNLKKLFVCVIFIIPLYFIYCTSHKYWYPLLRDRILSSHLQEFGGNLKNEHDLPSALKSYTSGKVQANK